MYGRSHEAPAHGYMPMSLTGSACLGNSESRQDGSTHAIKGTGLRQIALGSPWLIGKCLDCAGGAPAREHLSGTTCSPLRTML